MKCLRKNKTVIFYLVHVCRSIHFCCNLFACLIKNFSSLAHGHCLNSLNLNLISLLNIFTEPSVCLPFNLTLNESRSLVLGMQVT
jgi:hypothetical protein